MIIALAVGFGLLLVVCLILYIPYLGEMLNPGSGDTDPDPGSVWQPSTCEELLGKAMDASYQGCQLIGSNEICYGNNDVNAQLTDGSIAPFNNLGDTIPVNALQSLSTAPMDLNEDIWGIAVFKLQANLPGTVPGQNVSFLVFGDTGIYNYSGDMYSIYFSTGVGSVTCNKVPDGLKVDVPEGSGVVFNANGAEIALQGDSVLKANPGESMSLTMLNGSGTVTADGQSQSLVAGEVVTVPLDDSLESSGPPSIPLPLTGETAYEICLLSPDDCDDSGIFQTPTLDLSGVLKTATNTPVQVTPGQPTNTPVLQVTTASVGTTAAPVVTTEVPQIMTTEAPASTCGNVRLGNYSTSGNTVSINIINNNVQSVIIESVELSWNEGVNGQLDEFKFDTKTMWGKNEDTSSPANLSLSPAAPQRTVDGGASGTLVFFFLNDPVSALNNLKVHLSIGCSISK
jgi:hypothetical protein